MLADKGKPGFKIIAGAGFLFFCIFVILTIIICGFLAKFTERDILNSEKDSQQLMLANSIDALADWRNELIENAAYKSLPAMSRLLTVPKTDGANAVPQEDIKAPEDENLPDFPLPDQQSLLQDLIQACGWLDASLILPDDSVIYSSESSRQLSAKQLEFAKTAAQSGKIEFGPVYHGKHGLAIELAEPIFENGKLGAILFFSAPMDNILTSILTPVNSLEQLKIVERDENNLFMIYSAEDHFVIEPVNANLKKIENLPFEQRKSLDARYDVYSLGRQISAPNWLLLAEIPAAELDAAIQASITRIYIIGICASIALAIFTTWIFTRIGRKWLSKETRQIKNLYHTIHSQKMILESINSSFKAGLALVNAEGRLQMFNRAFADLCSRKPAPEGGDPLIEVLPAEEARRLLDDMEKVNAVERSASDEITLNNGSQNQLYRVTLYPYSHINDARSDVNGCVAIFIDITDFRARALAERKKIEKERQRQTALISAFMAAIENIDPYFVGHTTKMTELCALLAKELNLDERETETLELAARLSQIGKIYVPRDILTKKTKLTADELAEIRKAPQYASKILSDLDFDLPVARTIKHMGERLDGSGQPDGLAGASIPFCSRLLAVVNAFIAMTSPRPWRSEQAMTISQAIAYLQANAGFDQNIVNALSRLPKNDLEKIVKNTKTGSENVLLD